MEIYIVHIDYWTSLGHDELTRYCTTKEIAERVKADLEKEYVDLDVFANIHKESLITE